MIIFPSLFPESSRRDDALRIILLDFSPQRTIFLPKVSPWEHWPDLIAPAIAKHQQEALKVMPSGTVKWFNTTKGYGFIAPDSGGNDIFVHISAVERSGLTGLADNQKVSFELSEGRDGRQMATDLSLQ